MACGRQSKAFERFIRTDANLSIDTGVFPDSLKKA
jgi:hypothetical protein